MSRQMHGPERLASFEGFNFQALVDSLPIKEKDQRSKSEIISLLREEGDLWCQWVEQLPDSLLSETVTMPSGMTPPTRGRFEMLLGTKEHEMHHRAQLMVVERLLGVVPHLTRNRQAAAGTAQGTGQNR
jgi:uncharacterized damage-inducible protein DinB